MYQDQERTASYGPPQTARVAHHIFKHGSPRLVIFALIAGLLGVAVAAVCLAMFLSYRSTATTQIRQLQEAVSNAQESNQSNVSSFSSLNGKVNTIGSALSALVPYNQVCSQALVTQTGTGQFWYPCTDQKP
jgi:hypothetical protein